MSFSLCSASSDLKVDATEKCSIEKESVEASALELAEIQDKMFNKAFMDCLANAVNSGELSKTADIELITTYLLHFLAGMNVMGLPNKGKAEAKKLVELVMSTITS